MVGIGWVAGPESRITSRTARFTTCSSGSGAGRLAVAAGVRCQSALAWRRAASAGDPGALPQRSSRARVPCLRLCSTTPGRYRPITAAISALIDGERDTLEVVNPYVTDRGIINRIVHAAQRGAGCVCGAGEPQQLGLRCRRAVPPRTAARGRGSASGYPRMLQRRRSSPTASTSWSAPATSRRGA